MSYITNYNHNLNVAWRRAACITATNFSPIPKRATTALAVLTQDHNHSRHLLRPHTYDLVDFILDDNSLTLYPYPITHRLAPSIIHLSILSTTDSEASRPRRSFLASANIIRATWPIICEASEHRPSIHGSVSPQQLAHDGGVAQRILDIDGAFVEFRYTKMPILSVPGLRKIILKAIYCRSLPVRPHTVRKPPTEGGDSNINVMLKVEIDAFDWCPSDFKGNFNVALVPRYDPGAETRFLPKDGGAREMGNQNALFHSASFCVATHLRNDFHYTTWPKTLAFPDIQIWRDIVRVTSSRTSSSSTVLGKALPPQERAPNGTRFLQRGALGSPIPSPNPRGDETSLHHGGWLSCVFRLDVGAIVSRLSSSTSIRYVFSHLTPARVMSSQELLESLETAVCDDERRYRTAGTRLAAPRAGPSPPMAASQSPKAAS
ncbi:uncharacterized protein GGS25DRAFT_530405 [Hypoxylon fragiforme]|uniref:uncharacterized protein n=1 Tax=Hypoxylon fragiforme TaxID=63214 RepID=UPI0020C5F684|nr:uncharacterized protein GGS25DRAFT_530405 [Hypoxylon fragiforme]KAI2611676.1 hypothetical protein GGS25DRAFT_530405 [Hypoxylon fragiforme]